MGNETNEAIGISIIVILLTIALFVMPIGFVLIKDAKTKCSFEKARIVMPDGMAIESSVKSIKIGEKIIEVQLK